MAIVIEARFETGQLMVGGAGGARTRSSSLSCLLSTSRLAVRHASEQCVRPIDACGNGTIQNATAHGGRGLPLRGSETVGETLTLEGEVVTLAA